MQHKGTVVVLAATIALTARVLLADESGTFNWPQWGQPPASRIRWRRRPSLRSHRSDI
jgi:hypothetical protein